MYRGAGKIHLAARPKSKGENRKMKRILKSVTAILLIAATIYAFSSCTLFSSIRKRVEDANNTTLATTPEEGDVVSHFNGLLKASVERADKINENTEYKFNGMNIKEADDSDAGALGKSATMLRKMVAEKNPGRAERTIEDKNISDTLLDGIDPEKLLDVEYSRNTRVANVTNEKGNEIEDENGEVVTEIKITDNILKTVFKYFKDIKDENGTTAEPEEGETAAEPTTRIFADDDTIKDVFGEQADKTEVLANFDCIKNYITVVDYEIAYGSCEIRSDIELVASDLSDISFTQPMTVTAHVKGVGALAEYGDLTVTLEITKNVSYSFVYPSEATTVAE